MSLTIHRKYKYFLSTVQTAEDRRQKFHFCRLPFDVSSCLISITYDLLEDRRKDDVIKMFWFLYYIKQTASTLPCVCSLSDHRRRQNVVRTSVTHSPNGSCATFLFLPHFDVICDLLSVVHTSDIQRHIHNDIRRT